jgi:hypothetical protein
VNEPVCCIHTYIYIITYILYHRERERERERETERDRGRKKCHIETPCVTILNKRMSFFQNRGQEVKHVRFEGGYKREGGYKEQLNIRNGKYYVNGKMEK